MSQQRNDALDQQMSAAAAKVSSQKRKLRSMSRSDATMRDEEHALHSMRQNASTIKTIISISKDNDDT